MAADVGFLVLARTTDSTGEWVVIFVMVADRS